MEKAIKNKSTPLALLAELTHKCPLKCFYCSNPLNLVERKEELSTSEWQQVFSQAAELGVLQVHLSGGEPLAREDLEVLVGSLTELDLYTNLITSGIGLTQSRLAKLIEAGLSNVQVSIQSPKKVTARDVAGVDVHDKKLQVLKLVKDSGIYLTINVVLHRMNIDQVDEIISLGTEYNANRIELANCQYHGWALKNREALLPSLEQVEKAHEVYLQWNEKLKDKTQLVWVYSDYFSDYPKPCMGGWAKRQMTVSPNGQALPCPDAGSIDSLEFPNVREEKLTWIWNDSPGFNAFRGFDWMKEPCVSCDRRFEDFGGCRCQAFALTGDAASVDPACHLSRDHNSITEIKTFKPGISAAEFRQ